MLFDTSVWSDHLRRGDALLARHLAVNQVLMHPMVIGEIACGLFHRRDEVLEQMALLPAAPLLSHAEVLGFVNRHRLAGRGVGWVDMHLLASARVAGVGLLTRDKRLAVMAAELGADGRTA